jgi:WD40 repeat protein
VSLPSTRDDGLYRDLVNKVVRPKAVMGSLAKRRKTAQQAAAAGLSRPRDTSEGDDGAVVQADDTLLDNAEKLGAFSIEAAVEVSELTAQAEAAEASDDHHVGVGRTSGGTRKDATSSQLTRGVALEPSIVFATVTHAYEGMTCLDINPTVTQMVSGHRDSCVRVWRLNPSEGPHFGRYLKTHDSGGDWVMKEVLPKTKRMMQEEASRRANMGHKRSGGASYSGNLGGGQYPMLELRGHSQAVYGVSQDISRGGSDRLILSSSADETIRLWDTAVSQCVGRYNCVSPAWAVAFSPVGYHFASGNQDHTGTVYATDRVAPLRLLTGHTSDVNCLTWHANATLLATGSDDKTARLWDIRTSHSVRLLRGSTAPISCTAVSPLGNLLAAGADNGRVYVWDLTTTRPLAVLQGHAGSVHSVAFSNDGAALTSGGADCSVRVWDLQEVIDTQIKLLPVGGTAVSTNAAAAAGGASSSAGKAGTSASLLGIAKTAYLDAPQLYVRPQHTFHTKFSPVFHVGYTAQNLLYAGGPFSQVAATGQCVLYLNG